MATHNRIERIRLAVAEASRRLEFQSECRQGRPPCPTPGDLYVFGSPVDAAIEWLVVRPHPDDPGLILLAPADDFPLVGRWDLPLQPEFFDRPLTVRCGEAGWVPATTCLEHLRLGAVPDEAIAIVRRKLAALARGSVPDEQGAMHVDMDPEYTEWLAQLALVREAIQARVHRVAPLDKGYILPFDRFMIQPPLCLAEEPQLALAANSGGSLLAALGESLAADIPRYSEVPLCGGGTLVLTADAAGITVAWSGPVGTEPPTLLALGNTGRTDARWRKGIQAGLYRAEPVFPWVD